MLCKAVSSSVNTWGSSQRTHVRIDAPVFYVDAQGQHKKEGKHSLLLPHEIIGSFFDFKHVDLMEKLIGKKGVSWLQTGQIPNAH